MYQFNFRIPAYYTLLVRSLTVLEVRGEGRSSAGCACRLHRHS